MKTIICGDIKSDEVMEWCITNKKFRHSEQFSYGYSWGNGNVDSIMTNNDHFFNGIRVAIKERKVDHSNITILYFPGGEKERVDIRIDKNGRIKDWPDGFFDGFDKELMRLI